MNERWRTPPSERGTRRRFQAVILVVAFVAVVACGDDSEETSTERQLSADAAYTMAVEATEGDPALTEPIPKAVFETLARTMCEQLDEGGSPDVLLATLSETPTQTGKSMRSESARAIASAGVRAYCPQHASKLQ